MVSFSEYVLFSKQVKNSKYYDKLLLILVLQLISENLQQSFCYKMFRLGHQIPLM